MAKKAKKKSGKSATKAELIEALADRLDVPKSSASNIFDEVFGLLKDSLDDNHAVSVPGFGTFTVQHLAARKGRNPRTNETIQIKASNTIRFKPAAGLKRDFN